MVDGTPQTDLLAPPVLEEAAPFWEGCANGRLLVQHCDNCDTPRFPPAVMCAKCGSTDRSWRPSSGTGTVWSFAVPHPPLLPAYERHAPFVVAVVELDHPPGVRLVGNLLDRADGALSEVDPATVTIGEPVTVAFTQRGDVTIPQWVRNPAIEKGQR